MKSKWLSFEEYSNKCLIKKGDSKEEIKKFEELKKNSEKLKKSFSWKEFIEINKLFEKKR